MRTMLTVGLVLAMALSASCAFSGEGKEGKKGMRGGGGGMAPEALEKILTGDLVMNAEQKAKLTESYDKTLKPMREKMRAAQGADAKKALIADFSAANETYRTEVKKVLNEAQYKKVEEAVGTGGKPGKEGKNKGEDKKDAAAPEAKKDAPAAPAAEAKDAAPAKKE